MNQELEEIAKSIKDFCDYVEARANGKQPMTQEHVRNVLESTAIGMEKLGVFDKLKQIKQ